VRHGQSKEGTAISESSAVPANKAACGAKAAADATTARLTAAYKNWQQTLLIVSLQATAD